MKERFAFFSFFVIPVILLFLFVVKDVWNSILLFVVSLFEKVTFFVLLIMVLVMFRYMLMIVFMFILGIGIS